MDILIIFAHPWKHSFNATILNHIEQRLKQNGTSYRVVDLYKEQFNPVLEETDLSTFSKGLYQDPLAEKYARYLKEAKEVIFIYPIWWYGPPAIIKGFFDKVFLKNHIYSQENRGPMKGLLNLDKTIMITTANMSEEDFADIGDPIRKVYLESIMGLMGSKEQEWIHCSKVHEDSCREALLQKIDSIL